MKKVGNWVKDAAPHPGHSPGLSQKDAICLCYVCAGLCRRPDRSTISSSQDTEDYFKGAEDYRLGSSQIHFRRLSFLPDCVTAHIICDALLPKILWITFGGEGVLICESLYHVKEAKTDADLFKLFVVGIF